MDGCPACERSKEMCKNKDLKFNYYIRADHEDTVKRIAPGYKYVPVVVDENGKFIGGSIELEKYLEKY
jgi:glutaredoxin